MRAFLFCCILLISAGATAATQLNVWHMLKEMDNDFSLLATQFSAQHAEIDVSVQLLPNEELKAAVIRAKDQVVAPDIIIISSDNLGYAPLMHLSEVPTGLQNAQLAEPTLHALQFRQKNYAIPLFAGNHLLFLYNKQWVKQPVTQWQQLFEAHSHLAAKGVSTLALNYLEPYWFALFADLFGASLVQDNQVALNNDSMAKALEFYQQLVTSGVAQADCGYQCVSEAFYQGQYAYAINGTWALADAKARLGDNLGVAIFPTWQDHSIKPHASYIVMIFPHKALEGTKAVQIKEFVKYFSLPENLQRLAAKHYLIPYYQLTDELVPVTDPLYQQVLAQHQLSQLMPATEAMVSVWNAMQKGLLLHKAGTLTATEAAAFMQKVALRDQQLLAAGK